MIPLLCLVNPRVAGAINGPSRVGVSPDAHTLAQDDCVWVPVSCCHNDGAASWLLQIEGAQVDVTQARKDS